MKIGHLENKAAQASIVNERKAAAPAGQASGGQEPSAKVELSAAAKLLASDGTQADFDADKVSRIAQAIRDGKFVVNAEAIADKLIINARELMGPPKQ